MNLSGIPKIQFTCWPVSPTLSFARGRTVGEHLRSECEVTANPRIRHRGAGAHCIRSTHVQNPYRHCRICGFAACRMFGDDQPIQRTRCNDCTGHDRRRSYRRPGNCVQKRNCKGGRTYLQEMWPSLMFLNPRPPLSSWQPSPVLPLRGNASPIGTAGFQVWSSPAPRVGFKKITSAKWISGRLDAARICCQRHLFATTG
jgi:hypothetical protein